MTREEQEWGSRRYAYAPLTIVRLSTGAWAIGSGWSDRELFTVLEEEQVLQYLAEFQDATLAEAQAPKTRRPAPDLFYPLDLIDLGDIDL